MQITANLTTRPMSSGVRPGEASNDQPVDQVLASFCKPPALLSPVGGARGWSEASLNESAQEFVKSRLGEDTDFGSLEGGNCGLTAYVLPENKARAVLNAAQEMYPGSEEFQAASFDSARQRMFGVLVSEDEPKLYVCLQNRSDGSCVVISDIGFVGGCCSSSISEKTQEALVPAASEKDREDDWEFLSGALAGSEPLNLGEEAGRPFWWQN